MVNRILAITAIIASILGLIGVIIIINNFSGYAALSPEIIEENVYSLEDIKLHNNVGSCWIYFQDQVYDVTMMINVYEESEFLKSYCGKEADTLSSYLKEIILKYKIGALK